MRSGVVAASLFVLCASVAGAQSRSADSAVGSGNGKRWLERLAVTPNAGVAWSPVSVSFDDARAQTEKGLWVHFGVRMSPFAVVCGDAPSGFCSELSAITVTPHVAYGATHLRGMNPESDPFAFSTTDAQSIQVSYELTKRIRPLFVMRRGRSTAELFENGDYVNYWGSATNTGFGFEVPITPRGRGLEITFLHSVGAFDTKETRDRAQKVKTIGPANKSFRAVALQVGWSGPFSGVSLPWQ